MRSGATKFGVFPSETSMKNKANKKQLGTYIHSEKTFNNLTHFTSFCCFTKILINIESLLQVRTNLKNDTGNERVTRSQLYIFYCLNDFAEDSHITLKKYNHLSNTSIWLAR